MEIKTEQNKTLLGPGHLTEPFRLLSAAAQGYQHGDIVENTVENTRPTPQPLPAVLITSQD